MNIFQKPKKLTSFESDLEMNQLEVVFFRANDKWARFEAAKAILRGKRLDIVVTASKLSVLGFAETIDIWPTTLRWRASTLGSGISNEMLLASGGTLIAKEITPITVQRKVQFIKYFRSL